MKTKVTGCVLLFLLCGLLLSVQTVPTDFFRPQPIPDSVFARMYGKSYKHDCTVPRDSLRYLKVRHYDAEGTLKAGEIVCHKAIADDLSEIFAALYEARYPIERVELIDRYDADDERSMTANNTSAFNFRRIAGSHRLSNHSDGRAIDINPLYNPCVSKGGQRVQPAAGKRYADRSKTNKYKIERGDLCYRLFKQHGFRWGGEWRSLKDYQHFEK